MKIAIVHHQPAVVDALWSALGDHSTADERHRLAWVARDGEEAATRCAAERPDLLFLDLLPPTGPDAAQTTRRIMAQSPCAILLVSDEAAAQTARVFAAMGAGALDVVPPPVPGQPAPAALLTKLDTVRRLIGKKPPAKARPAADRPLLALLEEPTPARERLVAIGSSAGGPAALATILGSLPADFAAPVVIVQHVDETFAPGLAGWLGEATPLAVRLARPGDCPEPGVVLIAGRGDHLHFTGPRALGYTPHPADYAYRPSVDVFFESAARLWRGTILGVLLTGMGRDGALGLKTLRERGHHTIAQDQATSAIYGMPRHAATIGAAAEILPLTEMAAAMRKFASGKALRVGPLRESLTCPG